MAKNTSKLVVLLPLALTLLLANVWVSQGNQQRLKRGQQFGNQCQIDQLTLSEPTTRIQSEAGVTEVWEPSQQQELLCAGVTLLRHQIEPKGLALPRYANAPLMFYVVSGKGIMGVNIPGCPETYESSRFSSQRSSNDRREDRSDDRREDRSSDDRREDRSDDRREDRSSDDRREDRSDDRSERRSTDRHQKIRRIQQGDIIALPAGVSVWVHNDGHERMILVSMYDTDNFQNQLDDNLKMFFLAGNPRDTSGGRVALGQNILRGFSDELLSEVFFNNLEREAIDNIKGQRDNRGEIIRVEGDFQVLSPEREQEEQTRDQRRHGHEARQSDREGRREGDSNGIEETLCHMRVKENIDNPEFADVFNPLGGRLTTLNSNKLPILNSLQLSAEKVSLYKNAILAPHWKVNAHAIYYFTNGQGRIQIVNNEGRLVFDDTVREGRFLVVPQNFVILTRAGRDGLQWVSFLTNDEAMISPLAGRISAIRGMPEEVVMNSYRLSREEAKRLKYGREEFSVFSPASREDRRGDEFSIV